MRTLDRNYLATHPAGDTPAEFNVSIPLRASVDVPDNADGTRPRVSLKATSDTYANLLTVLSYVHDEEVNENAFAILLENIDEKDLEGFASMEEAAPFLRAAAEVMVTPFRTFTLALTLSSDDAPSVEATLELTAPSMVLAAGALKSLTKPNVLSDLAISFSPETDDDEYDEFSGDSRNEVLVVS